MITGIIYLYYHDLYYNRDEEGDIIQKLRNIKISNENELIQKLRNKELIFKFTSIHFQNLNFDHVMDYEKLTIKLTMQI